MQGPRCRRQGTKLLGSAKLAQNRKCRKTVYNLRGHMASPKYSGGVSGLANGPFEDHGHDGWERSGIEWVPRQWKRSGGATCENLSLELTLYLSIESSVALR